MSALPSDKSINKDETPSSTSAETRERKISREQHIQKAFATGSLPIQMDKPLANYLTTTDFSFLHRDDAIMKPVLDNSVLKVENGVSNLLKPIYSGEWRMRKEDQMFSIAATPHVNKNTGRYNTSIRLFGNENDTFLASVHKIAVQPEFLLTERSLPVETDIFRRQVKLLEADKKEGSLSSFVDTLDPSQLRMYLQERNPDKIHETVKQQIADSPNNGAYLEPLALYVGRYLTEKRLASIFPCYFSSFQTKDNHYYHDKLAKYNPIDCVYVVTEKLGDPASSYFAKKNKGASSGAEMMSLTAQIVINLALLQKTCGFVLGNLSMETIRFRSEQPNSNMYVKWKGLFYELPAEKIWQHTDWTSCSFVWNGVRLVSLDSHHLLENQKLPFHYDLVCFARSIRPYIDALPATDPYRQALIDMTDSWMNCANSEAGSSTEKHSIELMKLEEEACRGKLSKDCAVKFMKPLGKDGMCENAVPVFQSKHFGLFATNKRIPSNVLFDLDQSVG